ncbi:hypothetical protein BSPWISOXPB_8039 [uncultured Gammaproteobacteria bacterium]|nr:hypothetical protein BSPWISOXPB_8039 [uncultured Gammaproteobacteria bacterium]
MPLGLADDDKPKTTTTQDHKTYTLKLAETCQAISLFLAMQRKNLNNWQKQCQNGTLKIRIDSKNKHKSALGILILLNQGNTT